MTKILVLAFDPVGEMMPGPAIRAWNLADQVALAGHEVVLASTSAATRFHPSIEVVHADGAMLDELGAWADAIVAPVSVVRRHPDLAASDQPLCIDMYIPTHLENLEQLQSEGLNARESAVAHQVGLINEDLSRGDFFLCASERQRDFWLGSLAPLGRVNPSNYEADSTMRRLIDVVPFGLPDTEPVAISSDLRSKLGVGPSDPLVLWGGGVYNWFDPISLVEAVNLLKNDLPNLRLVFMGMKNPNPDIPEMRVANELRSRSRELGLTGVNVFFNDQWVPYDSRSDWLLEAQVGVSTHLDHIETRFSFRTRILDYLWAGLPMVLTAGDALADEVASRGLGVAVPPNDPPAIADGLRRMLIDPPAREAIRRYAREFRWGRVCGPLLRFCESPWRAADLPSVAADASREERTGDMPVEPDPLRFTPAMRPRWMRRSVGNLRRLVGTAALADRVRDLDSRLDSIDEQLRSIAASKYPSGPLYFGDDTALLATRWGARLLVHTRDAAMAPCLVLEGLWEPDLTRWVQEHLRRGDVFVDVGANIGYFTVLAGLKVGPNGRVVAVEAHPRVAEILQRNTVMNGTYGFTTSWNRAAWSESTTLTLHLRENFTSSSSIGDIGEEAISRLGDTQRSASVEAVCVDDLLTDCPKVDLIKVDVEGAEVRAFRGLEKTLAANPNASLIFEWAPELIRAVGDEPSDLVDQLESHGFTFAHFERQLAPLARGELMSLVYGNILARRRETGS